MQSTLAPAKPRAFFSLPKATFRGNAIEHRDDGSAIVKDVKVFKAGTFRDSWGDQHTWTAEHLALMVANYNLLKDGGIFSDVPVRRDHSVSIDKVSGYFDSLRSDGTFLYGDLLITEPVDVTKLINGTFRNQSLEVGMYVTNDEVPYWPVVFGVAFVDIPAVEGLHNKSAKVNHFSLASDKENPVTTETADPTAPAGSTINLHFSGNGTPSLVAPPASGTFSQGQGAPAPTPAPAPVAVPPAAPATFRIGGAESQDVAAVQLHIDTLEAFAKGVRDQSRKDFVKGLKDGNKILATQADDLEVFALGLSDAQYEQFTKSHESTPVQPLLSQHGQSAVDGGAPTPTPKADRITVLSGVVEQFKRAGKSKEWIAKTDAATELAQLTAS